MIYNMPYWLSACSDGELILQFLSEHRNLTVDHRLGDFCIDLGRCDMLMSQHLGKGLQRDSVLKADRRGIGMPREVKGELFVYAAFAGYVFKAVVDGIERRHFEKVTVAGHAPILIQNEQRIGQQLDDIFRLGFLAVTADPPIAVRILLQLIVGQRRHVGVTDTRKTREKEHIPIIILPLVTQAGRHHAMQLFFGQEAPFRIRSCILIQRKWIAGHPTIVKGNLDDIFQAFEIPADCCRLESTVSF